MSKTLSSNRRRTSKLNSSNSLNRDSSLNNISKYLTKQSGKGDSSVTKASVPCPDAAALPSSTHVVSVSKISNCVHKTNGDPGQFKKNFCSSSDEVSSLSSEITNSPICVSKKKLKKPFLSVRNSLITEYFPVRRSNRKTSIFKTSEQNRIIEDAILSGREEGFEVVEYPDKGRGVKTKKNFKRGEFVLEYSGELIDYEEAKRREGLYADKENIGCYMYYFKHKNKQYCIDATKETDRLGRLVNHSKKGNLKTKTFVIKDLPHLILFASRDIKPGEELCYDYGDRRKVALESNPWLAS